MPNLQPATDVNPHTIHTQTNAKSTQNTLTQGQDYTPSHNVGTDQTNNNGP